ncbi:MAG: hypothetical protein RR128_06335 [Clostridium sp.]
MAVDLEFYLYEESSGVKVPIGGAFGFGNLFKGNMSKVAIAIYNKGDTLAVTPTAKVGEYIIDGKDYSECYKWKKISLSKTNGFETKIQLPDIQPDSWMTGKDLFIEDFSKYPPASGAKPDQDWLLWGGSNKTWEIYSGYLQHNVDTIQGKALWNALPYAIDFEFSTKITVRDGVYAGYILRDIGDFDTGYIVLIQGVPSYFPQGMALGEGVIQVFKGKFSSGINTWEKLYQSGTIGVRGTHDYFKVRLTGSRFDFWYQNPDSPTPLYSFIDSENSFTGKSKPILCTHAGNGSTLIYFDEIRMEVANNFGLLWIENTVDPKTSLFGTQYSLLEIEFGGVE